MKVDRSCDNLPAVHGQDGRGGPYMRLSAGGRRRSRLVQWLDDFFRVTARSSTIATEVRAGCIAWMTMSYIMVVNPVILGKAAPGDRRLLEPVMTATALSSAGGSMLVGLTANAPLGLMPGMGLNAYFAFGICHAFGVSWEEAMTCCFASGLLLTVLSAIGVCQALVRKILSDHLKKAITVAIGLFQALIGFQVMGLVVRSSDTLVTIGDVLPGSASVQLYLSLGGLCVISALLVGQQLQGALMIGIWGMAACAWIFHLADPPSAVVAIPRFDAAFCLDFGGWMPGSGKLPAMLVGTLVLLFVALFDIAGVQYGLFGMAKLLKDGAVPRSNQIFASAGLSTMLGAVLGTSPVIIANESSAGIMEGAKTGLSAMVVAVLFLLSVFITPLLGAIPHVATAVPLVLIGAFMMAPCRGIDWDDLRVAIPSFLTITVVPFTYSIHNGIIAGILMDLFLDIMPQPAKKEEVQANPSPPEISPGLEGGTASGQPRMLRRLSSPSPHLPAGAFALASREKVDRAQRLLNDLALRVGGGPAAPTQCEEEAIRDEALLRALEAYLDKPSVNIDTI